MEILKFEGRYKWNKSITFWNIIIIMRHQMTVRFLIISLIRGSCHQLLIPPNLPLERYPPPPLNVSFPCCTSSSSSAHPGPPLFFALPTPRCSPSPLPPFPHTCSFCFIRLPMHSAFYMGSFAACVPLRWKPPRFKIFIILQLTVSITTKNSLFQIDWFLPRPAMRDYSATGKRRQGGTNWFARGVKGGLKDINCITW